MCVKRIKKNELKHKAVIVDEAHYLKNYRTERTKIICPFLMEFKRILLLTGTPALARPKELFTILKILRPDVL